MGHVTAYPFLSDEWIQAAFDIRERFAHRLPPPPISVKVNVVVTDIPHRADNLEGHIDIETGQTIIDFGHIPDAPTTITLDYGTARAAFVDTNPEQVMDAFLRGKILLEGDASQLMMLQASNASPDPVAEEMRVEVQAITASDTP